jgi:hypothetical protein
MTCLALEGNASEAVAVAVVAVAVATGSATVEVAATAAERTKTRIRIESCTDVWVSVVSKRVYSLSELSRRPVPLTESGIITRRERLMLPDCCGMCSH